MTTREDYALSVVVGTLNRLDRLRECIESITRDTAIPTKIYVTDAGSTDGTIEYLKKIASDRISVTLHERKLGQAKAYNEIFAQISTPYVCWLSDDNVVVNRGLENAVRILKDNSLIGMVALKVKDVQGPFADEPYVGGVSEAGILNVNQGVLRTEILQALGGFSEEFMDYGIDPDLTARVLYAGHDIVYTKDVSVQHWRDWGEAEAMRTQMAKQEAYKLLYREKYCHDLQPPHLNRLRFRLVGGIKRVMMVFFRMFTGGRAEHWSRDWYNIILGRYISMFDPIRSRGREYHLIQHCDHKTVMHYSDKLYQRIS